MDGALGERELDVMASLWKDGPGTVADVRNRLEADLAYNTVLTILRNLEAKRFVQHTAEGRTFRYRAAVSEHAVRRSALSRLVSKLFRGSSASVVAHLVGEKDLSHTELRELQRLVDERLSASPKPTRDSKHHAAAKKHGRRS